MRAVARTGKAESETDTRETAPHDQEADANTAAAKKKPMTARCSAESQRSNNEETRGAKAIVAQATSCSKFPFVTCSQWVRLGCGPRPCVCCRDPGDCLVCSVAILAIVFPSCLCGLAALVSGKVFWLVIGSDGFQTARISRVSGQVRAERVLAEAITIDGRKGWTCKFVAGDVIITSRCRCTGKYKQAIAAKSGDWSTGSSGSSGEEDREARSLEAENKELGARIDAMGKKDGAQKGSGISLKEDGDSEEVWGDCMEVEDDAECRKKMDEQRKKMQKEFREVERLSFASKEMQENFMESMQHQLQEVEKRRNDFMPEHQRVQKRSQKIQSIQDERKNMQKESLAAREEMRTIREEIDRKEERFRLLSDKVDNTMADAEMEAELQGLQAGDERRGSSASQTGDGCLESLWQQFIALGANEFETCVQRIQREMGAAQGQMPRREEGRRSSEDEQEQGRSSQQSVLPAPGGINEGAPASSLGLDLHRVRMRKGMMIWENWCRKPERKNSQGKDPRTFCRKPTGKGPNPKKKRLG